MIKDIRSSVHFSDAGVGQLIDGFDIEESTNELVNVMSDE